MRLKPDVGSTTVVKEQCLSNEAEAELTCSAASAREEATRSPAESGKQIVLQFSVTTRSASPNVAMRHQPARTFRNRQSHKKNQASQAGAYQETKPPAKIRIDQLGVKQYKRADRAQSLRRSRSFR